MNRLDTFLDQNSIDKDILMNALHLDIREIVLKAIIERMKTNQTFFITAKKHYFKYSNLEAARKIIQSICDFEMSDEDIRWFDECFKAFMKKKNTRITISQELKKEILFHQDEKCTMCGTHINLSTMHVDHIIPWDYVGDELENNYQGLCSDCNLHKNNHVAIAVSSIILNRRK